MGSEVWESSGGKGDLRDFWLSGGDLEPRRTPCLGMSCVKYVATGAARFAIESNLQKSQRVHWSLMQTSYQVR